MMRWTRAHWRFRGLRWPPARRSADAAVVLVFLGGILAPTIGSLSTDHAANVRHENRTLKPPPALVPKWWAIKTFPITFEPYFNDRIGFRAELLAVRRDIVYHALNDSVSEFCWIGTNGWKFINPVPTMSGYEAHGPDPAGRVRRWADELMRRHTQLSARGIVYVVVVAREKSDIYPEHLPANRARHRPTDLLPILRAAAPELPLIDCGPALLVAKASGGPRPFFMNDSHWTDTGAFAAYRELAVHLAERRPGFIGSTAADFRAEPGTRIECDMLMLQGVPMADRAEHAPYLRPRHRLPIVAPPPPIDPNAKEALAHCPPVAFETAAAPGPRCVLLHDSFGVDFVRMMAPDFVRVAAVGTHGLPETVLATEQPQVVVQLFVDRALRVRDPGGP
jgi:alginate O-acetyltransferase complex protein AlgJ